MKEDVRIALKDSTLIELKDTVFLLYFIDVLLFVYFIIEFFHEFWVMTLKLEFWHLESRKSRKILFIELI